MSIKMIVTDLDGTLMGTDHLTISQRNREAFQKASEQGIKIVIASGRTLSIMGDVIKQLYKVDYAIVSNGAGIIDVSTKKEIYNNGLEYDTLKKLTGLIEKYGGGYEIYAEGESYMLEDSLNHFVNPELSDEFMRKLKKAIHPIQSVEELKNLQIEKINVLDVEEKEKESLFLELKDFNDIEMTSSMPGNLEINGSGVHKGKALQALCEILGIKDTEVMAFGDGGNDVEMLRWAKRSYAMGNASYDAKEAARFVTKTNGEDGLAIEIEKIWAPKE
ncbi:MAG: HAD family phosphatase [Gallicola sp.]|nr:HAD family phosphatase [Gallicola sp.]